MTTSVAKAQCEEGAIRLEDNFTREDVLRLITPAVVDKLRAQHLAEGRSSIVFSKHTPPTTNNLTKE